MAKLWSMGHVPVQPCCKPVESCSQLLFDSPASNVQYLAMNEASDGRIGAWDNEENGLTKKEKNLISLN